MQLKIIDYIGVGLLLMVLLLIRVFESTLFYDPYILFFKSDFITKDAPNIVTSKLLLSASFRYVLNGLISIGVLYVLFKSKAVLRFSLVVFGVAMILLVPIYGWLAHDLTQELHMVFFYVRRFVIQPVFLLLLVPAFYYQQILRKN